MAGISYQADIEKGFLLGEEPADLVGHVSFLTVGGQQLAADLAVTDPGDVGGNAVMKVGVISDIAWGGSAGDPLELSCQISGANMMTVATLLHRPLANPLVQLRFAVHSYEPKERTYYKCFHTRQAILTGFIKDPEETGSISVNGDPSPEVQVPPNYTLWLSVAPHGQRQNLYSSISPLIETGMSFVT